MSGLDGSGSPSRQRKRSYSSAPAPGVHEKRGKSETADAPSAGVGEPGTPGNDGARVFNPEVDPSVNCAVPESRIGDGSADNLPSLRFRAEGKSTSGTSAPSRPKT